MPEANILWQACEPITYRGAMDATVWITDLKKTTQKHFLIGSD
jgi:hypothetical protein